MRVIKKLLREITKPIKKAGIKGLPVFIFVASILFFITLPALFIAGFSIGLMNFENPFKSAIELIEEIV